MSDIISNPLDTEALTANDVIIVPRCGVLTSRSDAKVGSVLYSAPMDTVTGHDLTEALTGHGQYAVISRFLDEDEQLRCIRRFAWHENVFFAIGFNDGKDFFKKWADIADEENWSDSTKINVALDIAHGDMEKAHDFINRISQYDFIGKVMSGSICTPDAAIRAWRAGCTHLRVGVGPGAACTTRLMTGCGFPQLSATYLIYRALPNIPNKPKIIADGGIKHPGDAVKYLAAGADGVMMGSVFSRCAESSGWEIRDRKLTKTYRGQASAAFQKSRYGKAHACPEGASSKPFSWEGDTVESTVAHYMGGISSAISYLGLRSTDDLKPDNVTFIRITHNGYREGTPHGI